jgi:4-amino-4-deoxy-L-arabinose transferase-like glycosyltransferase
LTLPPLAQRVLAPSDEVRFVIYAQEALQQHAAFDIHVRAKRFREKPPLYAWLIALTSWPGGRVTGFTARLPVAVAAIGAVVFTALIGETLLGPGVGVRSGLALAVTYGFFAHSQLILPDMLVVAFMRGRARLQPLRTPSSGVSSPRSPARPPRPPSMPRDPSDCFRS